MEQSSIELQAHLAPMELPLSPPDLILASTSRYRRELLERLRLPFDVCSPQVDEAVLEGETPAQVSERLALAKARAVALKQPQAWVIGSDQVAELDGEAIGKPGTHERALAQLRRMSGRSVRFHTAVAVVRGLDGATGLRRVVVEVAFRDLREEEIETYLQLERPYDCAGSAKCEGLGISLLRSIRSDDPTALIGLPLIATRELLEAAGFDVLARLAAQEGV